MPSHKELANALRILSMDAVERAQSGHPGAALGMADMAEVLWTEFVKHNPADPTWWNRDRFILSNGHASALMYSLLYLTGYDVTLEDLKNFRQLHSKTPGHPEIEITPGVDVTSGPLGQGIASAVGFALAERLLAWEFNRENFSVIDHFTYVFLGDGCLMEGVSHEACSLAGTLGLGKLIALWDDNGISIDGPVAGWFTEHTPDRFKAYGWHVIDGVDGHDAVEIKKAIIKARKTLDKPTLICCKTNIGEGCPNKKGCASIHGSPLGEEEVLAARKSMGWGETPFGIPIEIKTAWNAKKKGKIAQTKWEKLFSCYAEEYPKEARELARRMKRVLPDSFSEVVTGYMAKLRKEGTSVSGRQASKDVLTILGPKLPELLGGSADLTGSVGTFWEGAVSLNKEEKGNYISYGVREFAMGAIMNGLALHGGFISYGGTFLVFSDYAKGAMRLSALMKLNVIWVLTHDSIMVGEDGPTHQPIEQLNMLRSIPQMNVWRPCDAYEVAVAWQSALERKDGPTSLVLSRQNLPVQERDVKTAEAVSRGGYILKDTEGQPDVILIATGYEVALAMTSADALEKRNIKARVVSIPCFAVFEAQDRAWKEFVLPNAVRARVAIEAASTTGWQKYVGLDGSVVGINTFGTSAFGNAAYEYFGFTVENVIKSVKETLKYGACAGADAK